MAVFKGGMGILGVNIYDNFAYDAAHDFASDGETTANGLIQNQFRGGGAAGIRAQNGGGPNIFYWLPQVAISAGQTFSNRNDTTKKWTGNHEFRIRIRTLSQIRTGSAPNNWEVGWVIFNLLDSTHFYYFVQKISGSEFGKVDGAGQQILVTPGSPSITLGSWNEWRIRVIDGKRLIVDVDGSNVIDYTDNAQSGNYANNIPKTFTLYCEDSSCECSYIWASPSWA